MSHTLYGIHVKDVASKERLSRAYSIQKEDKKTAFYVLPSLMWLQEARRKQPGLLITTFDDMASFILKQANVSYIPLTEEERTLFFLQFIKEEEVFHGDLVVSGKARAYADTYGQLKRLGLEVEQIPVALKPLQGLFQSYESQVVHKRGLLDPENILLRAIEIIKEKPEQVQMSVSIDGYLDFSPLQALFIEALKKAGITVEIYLPNHTDFSIVDQTVKELVAIGFDDERGLKEEDIVMTSKELVAASTNEEQWRGVLEEICLSPDPYDKVGILVVDERSGMEPLERYSKGYAVPLNKPKKRKVSTTSIHAFILAILNNNGAPKSKWEQLPFVELILRLYQVNGLDYAKQKQKFLSTGEWEQKELGELFNKMNQLKWKQNETFVHFIKNVRDMIQALPFQSIWEKWFDEEEDVQKLKEVAAEYKALNLIDAQLKKYEQLLTDKGLDRLMMTHELFIEWVQEIGEQLQLFEQRASKQGVSIHTWRDVSLFKGDKLYVVGMNEGVFPAPHHLSGYVQERDLLTELVRFSPPTQEHFKMKQQAQLEQLSYIARDVTFTYVRGIDVNHPLLPSPLLEIEVSKREWSWESRMESSHSFTAEDELEKIAYHVGKGCQVEDVPALVERVSKRLERLEQADEPVTFFENKPLEPVISVTALESYARCPFRYGMERVLQVAEPEAMQERVSPLDIGQMMHAIIEELYMEMEVVGKSFSELRGSLELLPKRLEELFEEKWEQIERQSPEISRFDLQLTKNEWQKRLRRWWQAERKHFWDNANLSTMHILALEKPIRFELKLSDEKTLILTGKADRVDRLDDAIVVYDYKSGQASVKVDEIKTGLKLQLPLYAFAIRDELERMEEGSIKADGATYISLKEPSKRAGNGIWRSEHVGKSSRYQVSSHCRNREDELGTEQFLVNHELRDRIEQLWNGMKTNFPVEPIECSNFCAYRAVCRVTDEKRENANG
ncbi:PD-(D/E)XK nuclease family protein [Halalkalibacter alkalisediminis]|uniref:PD-(D/E)XK nuclease family protein n=1 Tax=Halalkalibacter alkalisediminis TaxID=935616 RepID=A0ABV6NC99_9BACI|nr:PD-(D/E)XK nuclease family protein [Halalkalibacter alkalisediminis]